MRSKMRLASGLCLSALALAACSNPQQRADRGNPAVCVRFNQPSTAAASSAALPDSSALAGAAPAGPQAVEDCVQRWAYSLAPSRDDADTVAEAVLAACAAPLTRWNQQIITQPMPEAEGASITTGQPTTPVAEHYAFTRSRALFYVVQARAGHCAPPPANATANRPAT